MSRLGRDHAYRLARRRLLADATVCAICGGPLDFDAPARSSLAPSADHVYPVSSMAGMSERAAREMASDISFLRPAHYGCNASRGDGRRDRPRHVSRRWS